MGHTESSNRVPVDPALERVQSVIGFALAYLDKSGANVPFFLRTILNEVMEEVADLDGENIPQYFLFCAAIMKWIATGEIDDIPADFLATIPSDVRERFALPSAS